MADAAREVLQIDCATGEESAAAAGAGTALARALERIHATAVPLGADGQAQVGERVRLSLDARVAAAAASAAAAVVAVTAPQTAPEVLEHVRAAAHDAARVELETLDSPAVVDGGQSTEPTT